MSAPKALTLVTRASPLARWQAEHVRARLNALYPACKITLLMRTTSADKILDRPLIQFGGKGLFVKELEAALLNEEADLAVHSLKDVPTDVPIVTSTDAPTNLPMPFALAAILARAEPRDAWVSNHYASLAELPVRAKVGTSSLRRESQLRARYPHLDLDVRPLRGNVGTRLQKLDRDEYDALLLATVGLQRLGLEARIRAILDVEESLPAAGQGALGLEIKAGREDVCAWLQPLSCPITTACVQAERAVARALGGACYVPLAAYAQAEDLGSSVSAESGTSHLGSSVSVESGTSHLEPPLSSGMAHVKHEPFPQTSHLRLYLRARVATPEGHRMACAQARGSFSQPESLGVRVAQLLLEAGGAEILAALQPPTA